MTLTADQFYQRHLDQVSRSFAFCIAQLPSPLRSWVSLSYLLCRVLDTVEDAPWSTPSDQLEAFCAFDLALSRPEANLGLVGRAFPTSLPEGERELLRESGRLFDDFHHLEPKIREHLHELIGTMSAGMQRFSRNRAGGPLELKTMAEVNQYCFFVAGVVGELLVRLVAEVEPDFRVTPLTLLRAHHFGLFLQKVNLLKDQVRDRREGRDLIPSREAVEASCAENARSALDFLIDLPARQVEFRRFCAWSLFLGLESILAARESKDEQRVVKVARARTEEILFEVEGGLQDRATLHALFGAAERQLGWQSAPSGGPRTLSQLGVNL